MFHCIEEAEGEWRRMRGAGRGWTGIEKDGEGWKGLQGYGGEWNEMEGNVSGWRGTDAGVEEDRAAWRWTEYQTKKALDLPNQSLKLF